MTDTPKQIFPGGLLRCCLQTLDEYDGPDDVGTRIGCKYHADPHEPVLEVTERGWEWVGRTKR